MKTIKILSLCTGLLGSSLVLAQTPTPPSSQPSDPSAASSPHQRQATKSQGQESQAQPGAEGTDPSAASTQAQKDQVNKKSHKKKGANGSSSPSTQPPASPQS